MTRAPAIFLPAALALPAPARAAFGEGFTGFLVVATIFLSVCFIVAASLYAGHRRKEMEHETVRRALEKGQQVPPELFRVGNRGRGDLRRGIILVALGVGLGLFLGIHDPEEGNWAVGFIPGLLGLGYLASWALGRRSPETDPQGGPGR